MCYRARSNEQFIKTHMKNKTILSKVAAWFKEGLWKFCRVGNVKHLTGIFREMGEGFGFSFV